jgi:hypothetical protein
MTGVGGDGKLPSVDHGPCTKGGRDKNINISEGSSIKYESFVCALCFFMQNCSSNQRITSVEMSKTCTMIGNFVFSDPNFIFKVNYQNIFGGILKVVQGF